MLDLTIAGGRSVLAAVNGMSEGDELHTCVRDKPEQIFAGQAVYTRRVLSGYDLFVLGISNRWLWRCPTQRLELD